MEVLWRPFDVAASTVRASFRALSRHRRLRAALLAALLVLGLLAGGWLLLRKSSFVAVEHVRVSGVHGPDGPAIETALAGAARQMSTLEVNTGALRAAVASFPVIRAIRATPSFPHGLHIDVVEQPPVAALTVGGERTAVAGDGVVLGPALLSGSLPALSGSAAAIPTGARVGDATLRGTLTVLGDAPAALAGAVKRAYTGPKGLVLEMRNGLLAYFGDASLPHAKWLSLARVLADSSSAGAAYVDVRLPERPAAGFAGGTVPEAGAPGHEAGSVSDPSTAAALASGLTAAVGGGSSTASPTTTPTPSEAASGATTTEAPPPAGAEAPSGASESPSAGAAGPPARPPASGG